MTARRDSHQISVKVSPRVIRRAEGLKAFVEAEQGRDASLADVYRQALSLGLAQMTRRQRERSGAPTTDDDDEADRELVDETTTASV